MATEGMVAATPRRTKGTSDARRSRRAGRVPGILYGRGNPSVLLELDEHDFTQELRRHSSEQVMVDLEVEGEPPQKVLVKEVQHHPFTGRIVHVDFLKVDLEAKIRVSVQIELAGDPIGVTRGGGVLETLLREVEVECMPSAIPAVIKADVSSLDIGESLTLGELSAGDDAIEVLGDPTIAVAHVTAPRVAAAEAGAEEEAEASEVGES